MNNKLSNQFQAKKMDITGNDLRNRLPIRHITDKVIIIS